MKKVFCSCLLLLLLCSCSHKKTDTNPLVADFTFQLLLYKVKGECRLYNPEKYYIPDSFVNLMMKNKDGLYLVESVYPECIGVIDSTGFYLENCEDGNWIDGLLNEIEEEKFSDTLDSLIEHNQTITTPYSESKGALETVEKRLLDSNLRLESMEYEKEIFIPQKLIDNFVFINSNEKEVTRNFFDNSYRLIKKETWNIPNVQEAKKLKTEEYSYNGDSIKPYYKIIRTEKEIVKTFYTENGLPEISEFYDDKKVLLKTFEWVYDNDDRIICETETDVKEAFVKKQNYSYNQNEDISPDYEYYENNELRLKTVYTDKGTYVTKIFFEDDFTVTTYYVNNKKIKEEYREKDIIIREKNYE